MGLSAAALEGYSWPLRHAKPFKAEHMTASNAIPAVTYRPHLLTRLAQSGPYDLLVVGGGATGLGVALDAASRGLSVALVESHDFAKGASSRATKLAHGGVRYLAQGNIFLVREALRERAAILHNAPHLAAPLSFVVPGYRCWEALFYAAGLKLYEALAGRAGIGGANLLSARQTVQCLPGVRIQGLKGGARYWDGQFDDARLALALARTAAREGAVLLNYCKADHLLYEKDRVAGVQCRDTETGDSFAVHARCVVNATGVWVDALRQQDSCGHAVQKMVVPSRGVHLVVDRSFLAGDNALLVPRTRDGRVLFAVPWLGKLILGTTDTPSNEIVREPQADSDDVDFILSEAARYLAKAPRREDVTSIWAGLRPLVRPGPDAFIRRRGTGGISREHTVALSSSGLVSVTGGKWTTYRAMAQDVLAHCAAAGLLPPLPPCRTEDLLLVGADPLHAATTLARVRGLEAYGCEADTVRAQGGADIELCPGLTQAMLRFAAVYEYARTVEDVLARRSRILFLDAALAASIAPQVAGILQEITGGDPKLDEFMELAKQYGYLP